jgi:hypothetical protein
MQEAEGRFGCSLQIIPVAARRFQQGKCAQNIGGHKIPCPGDRAVDMAFRRQMHHALGAKVLDQLVHRGTVTNVRMGKCVSGLSSTAFRLAKLPA